MTEPKTGPPGPASEPAVSSEAAGQSFADEIAARLDRINSHPDALEKKRLGKLLESAHLDPRIAGRQSWSDRLMDWRDYLHWFVPSETATEKLEPLIDLVDRASAANPKDWIAGLCALLSSGALGDDEVEEKQRPPGPADLGDTSGSGVGFWVNLTPPDLREVVVPDLSGVVKDHVDGDALMAWFAPHLAQYRSRMMERDLLPSPAEELKVMRRFGNVLSDLQTLLAPGGIPPRAWAALGAWALKNGYDWCALIDRMQRDAMVVAALSAGLTNPAAEPPKGRPGARKKTARGQLQAELVKWLRDRPMQADLARQIAQAVLDKCGIDTPLIKGAGKTRGFRRAELGG